MGWLSRIDKDAKEARNKRIFDLWLACYTEQEIADAVGLSSKQSVQNIVSPFMAELPKVDKPAAEHLTDFEPPIYNVWTQQKKKKGSNKTRFAETYPCIFSLPHPEKFQTSSFLMLSGGFENFSDSSKKFLIMLFTPFCERFENLAISLSVLHWSHRSIISALRLLSSFSRNLLDYFLVFVVRVLNMNNLRLQFTHN